MTTAQVGDTGPPMGYAKIDVSDGAVTRRASGLATDGPSAAGCGAGPGLALFLSRRPRAPDHEKIRTREAIGHDRIMASSLATDGRTDDRADGSSDKDRGVERENSKRQRREGGEEGERRAREQQGGWEGGRERG